MLLTAKKWVVFSVGLVLFVIAARDGRAANQDWTGTTSSDYFNGTNWLSGTVPVSGDAVRVGNTGTVTTFPVYNGDNTGAQVTFDIGAGQASSFTVQSGTLQTNNLVKVGTGAFTSTWTQNGGNVTINGAGENGTTGLRIGTVANAVGQLVMGNGTITVSGGRLVTAETNTAKANITMSGGTISTVAVHMGSDGVSSSQDAVTTLNLTGGTITSSKEFNFGSSNSNSATHYAGYVNATISNGALWATTPSTNGSGNQLSTIRFQGGHINLGVGAAIKGGDMSGRDGFNYGNVFDYASAGLPKPGLDFRGGVLEMYGDGFNLEGNGNMGASCAVTAASNNPACYFAVPQGVDPTADANMDGIPDSYKAFNNRTTLRMLVSIEQGPADTPFRFYTSLGGTLDGSGNPIPDNTAGDYFVKVVDASGTTSATPTRAFATIKGDYNGNGVVDAADYVVWREFKGYTYLYEATDATSVIPYFGADGTGDGIVDQSDYDVWRANFGKTAIGGPFAFAAGAGNGLAAGSSAVPEPTSALIMLVGCVVASFATSRGRKSSDA